MTDMDERDGIGRVNRRRFVQGVSVGTVGGLAGCLGEDDDDEENGNDDNGGDSESEGAFFEVGDLEPGGTTIEPGETIDVSATIANTGDADGSQDVEVRLDGDAIDSEGVDLEPEGEDTVSFGVETDGLDDGEYAYGVHSEDDDATATVTVATGVEPIIGDLTYSYYEDIGSDFPNFEELDAVETGTPEDRLISLSPRAQSSGYGFVFEGELDVGEWLDPGRYTFTLEADPAVRLLVDGSSIVDSPDGPVDGSSPVQLGEGTHEIRLEYADPDGTQTLALGWEDPYEQLLPRICEDDPNRTGQEYGFELEVRGRAATKRMDMPDSSVRSLSVGLPPNTNYCFDTETGAVQYGWRGAFLDAGPMIAYGDGRGNEPGNGLGGRFPVGAVDYPLRFGSETAEPDVEFRGYHEWPHPPAFRYAVDGHEVTQTVERVPNELGLQYTFEIEDPPSEPIYFLTAEDAAVERESSAGEWDGAVLEVPGGESTFSVTILSNGGEF